MVTMPVIITPDPEGGFFVRCPLLNGCISQGDTRDEAVANIRLAIGACLRHGDRPSGAVEIAWIEVEA